MLSVRGLRCAAPVLAAAIFVFSASALLAPRDAAAQFVCADTGGSGQGANASGSSDNMACGPNANATSSGSAGNISVGSSANSSGLATVGVPVIHNIAIGSADPSGVASGANAAGNGGNNIALGSSSNASGAVSVNVAIGFGATANAPSFFGQNVAIGGSAFLGGAANASGDVSVNVAIGSGANASGSGSIPSSGFAPISNVAIGLNANSKR